MQVKFRNSGAFSSRSKWIYELKGNPLPLEKCILFHLIVVVIINASPGLKLEFLINSWGERKFIIKNVTIG